MPSPLDHSYPARVCPIAFPRPSQDFRFFKHQRDRERQSVGTDSARPRS
jgi:hypothetical protein